jgi:TonB family protein
MQKHTLTTLIIILHFSVFAQDTTWFDSHWVVTTVEKGYYYRTKTKTDTGWVVKDHYPGGKLQMSGNYADDSCKVQDGEFRWYNDKGIITHVYTYRKGKPHGLEILYYTDGQEKVKGNISGGERDGPWTAYYPSGKIAGKATYNVGKQSSVVLFHEDGSRNNKDSIFQRDSDYPGGIPQYTRFLNKTLRYPDSAVVHEIQGTVVLQFKISKEGKVSELKVIGSVDKYLDEEALRVMRLMPDWQPAIFAGTPCESYHTQPVIFSLKGQ